MLAYAANRRRIAQRQSSPNAMLMVVCAHIVAVAVVMSIKMDLPRRIIEPIPKLIDIRIRPDIPPPPVSGHATSQTHITTPPQTQTRIADTSHDRPDVSTGASTDQGPINFAGTVSLPNFIFSSNPVMRGAQLITPESELRPPYPASKLLNEEQTALRLRLAIDENGRVVAVDPVGAADPVFLTAARKHLLAHWRYKPATQDGRPVATSIVITLRFELDG